MHATSARKRRGDGWRTTMFNYGMGAEVSDDYVVLKFTDDW